jgi:hypothetical protein
MPRTVSGLYEFGPFRLDPEQRILTREHQALTLAPKTFDLLTFLVEHQGRVLSKQELMHALWPETFVEEANLSFQVSVLRKALGAPSSGSRRSRRSAIDSRRRSRLNRRVSDPRRRLRPNSPLERTRRRRGPGKRSQAVVAWPQRLPSWPACQRSPSLRGSHQAASVAARPPSR